ncbi:MAG: bifunctional RNase H/acid phosphatase [Actinophytocola sp.]|nr:bifunctional RNase H/acid phosphatase [Actinophytocola sp.]
MSGHVVVEADGGSRGNPGPAGYGALVRDPATGELLAERKGGLGIATNNVAEYTGLIEGLRAAADLGAVTVEARLDSKLVVEQMSGRWKIKNTTLQPLALQARELASRFSRITYTWIPRARNAHADRLANEAMDAQAGADDDPEPARRQPSKSAPAAWTGATGTPTRLYLLRHGQTPLSAERRYSGRGDVELTEEGLRQAAAAAKRLAAMGRAATGEPLPIVASPLLRAVRTANEVTGAIGGEVRTHRGLLETDFGEWEGLSFTEAAERDPEVHRSWLGDSSVAPPGGESFDVVHRRVRRTRDDLISEYGGRDVVVVSHVTPIKSLLRMGLNAGPELLFRLHLDLASLSIVEFYPDGNASVRLVNDTSHLD